MSQSASVQPGQKPASGQSAAKGWALTLVMNIALPIATYFVATSALGMAEIPALLLSAIWPVIEIGYTVWSQRHVDEFSIFVLIGLVIGVLTTVYSDNARGVFLKDSITTGLIGLAFLGSLLTPRPLSFYFGRRFATDGSKVQRDWWDGLLRFPQFRGVQRHLSLTWGIALLGEAAIRAILTWKLGTAPMVVVNNVVPYMILAALIFYSIAIGRRSQARARAAGHDEADAPLSAPETEAPVAEPGT